MLAIVRKLVPSKQILVLHADLSDVVWKDTTKAARESAHGLPFQSVKVSLFDMVRKRGMWPSPAFRQCTSDLKRTPLNRLIRQYAEKHGFRIVVSAIGLRAEEGERAKKPILELSGKLGGGPRQYVAEWYIWLPIHRMKLPEVWATIKRSGQKRHKAYDYGSTRCSCPFCIMANRADLQVAALHNPELLEKYARLEKQIGHTVFTRTVKGNVVPVPIKEHIVAGKPTKAGALLRKRWGMATPAAPKEPDKPKRRHLPVVTAEDFTPGPKKPRQKPKPLPAPKAPRRKRRDTITADELIAQALGHKL